jgi:RNA polymerase sigma-70 factor, ECF subfamily
LTIDLSIEPDPQFAVAPPSTDAVSSLAGLRDGVLYLLRKELRDFTLAEDLCNETFRIVLERLQRQPLEEPSKISSYLAQTARNLVIEHRRRDTRQLTVTGHQAAMEAIGDADLDPAQILQSQSRAVAVRKVLQEIPLIRDREVLVRVYLYEQDKDQVCRELGISADHYKRVVHRARERFRTLIEQRHVRADL